MRAVSVACPAQRCEAWEIDEHMPKVDKRSAEAATASSPRAWDLQPQTGGRAMFRSGIGVELVRVGHGVTPVTLQFKTQGEAARFLGTSAAQVSLRKRSGRSTGAVDGFMYTIRQL